MLKYFVDSIIYITFVSNITDMEEKVLIQLQLPKSLSLHIDRLLIDLKENGVKTTKAEFIIKMIGLGIKSEHLR